MKKIAVLIWLYHEDLAKEIYDLLKPISQYVDIFLALCEDKNNRSIIDTMSGLNNVKNISFFPNCGADIYSFINQITNVNPEEYEYFIKIHSKKNNWGENKICNWRAMLLDNIIGSQKIFEENIKYIDTTNAGMYGCKPLLYDEDKIDSSPHKPKIKELMNMLDIEQYTDHQFFGGTMFVGKVSLYQKVLNNYTDRICYLLSKEKGKIEENRNGTYSHAMERILGYIGCSGGLRYLHNDYVCIKTSSNDLKKSYPYLDFRIMYNNDIYCLLQPSIYGSITKISDDGFSVIWKQMNKLANYSKIRDNIYTRCLND